MTPRRGPAALVAAPEGASDRADDFPPSEAAEPRQRSSPTSRSVPAENNDERRRRDLQRPARQRTSVLLERDSRVDIPHHHSLRHT